MNERRQAFYYEYRYYLMPDGCFDVQELAERGTFRCTRLGEEHCIAPNFICEDMREEELTITDVRRVFPVEVTIYPQAEYNALLEKQMARSCAGCLCYGPGKGDDEYTICSLDGVCFMRREDRADDVDISDLARWFWQDMQELAAPIAACIDKGDDAGLNELVKPLFERYFIDVIPLHGTVTEGKYALYACGGLNESASYRLLVSAWMLSGQSGEGDNVFSEWTLGNFRPLGSFDVPDPAPDLCARIEGEEFDRCLIVYAPEEGDELARVNAVYEYLCAKLGENVVLGFFEGVQVSDSMTDMLSPARLVEEIGAQLMQLPEECDFSRVPCVRHYSLTEHWAAVAPPLRTGMVEGVSSCLELSAASHEQLRSEESVTSLLTFCYLHIPHSGGDEALPSEVLLWYLGSFDQAPREIITSPDACVSLPLGMSAGDEEYVLDFLVFGPRYFYDRLRRLAPVLKAYGAKLVVINREDTVVLHCDESFTPVSQTEDI